MYLTQSVIADDLNMKLRIAACMAQQQEQGAAGMTMDPDYWTHEWRRSWAAAPGWDAAWEYALANHTESDYQPGKDTAVITDEQILSQVQSMMPFVHVGQLPTTPGPTMSLAEEAAT